MNLRINNIKLFLLFGIISLMLASCSSKSKLLAVLDSYYGYHSDSLYAKFGSPNNILDNGNRKILVYGFNTNTYMPSTISPYGGLGYSTGFRRNIFYGGGGGYVSYSCRISFSVDKKTNKILTAEYMGNSCDSYAKRDFVNPDYILELPNKYSHILGFTYKRTKKGLKVEEISQDSQAYQIGLRKDDIIQKINGKSFINLPIEFASDEFNKNDSSKIEVLRGKRTMIMTVKKTDLLVLSLYKNSIKKFLGFAEQDQE